MAMYDNPAIDDGHESVYSPCRHCAECGNEMPGDEWAFEIESGYWVCWDCFMDYVDQFDAVTLADALGVNYKEVGDIE